MNSICLRFVPIWSKGSMTCISSVVDNIVRNLKDRRLQGSFLSPLDSGLTQTEQRPLLIILRIAYKQQTGLNLSHILHAKHLLSILTPVGLCSGSKGAQGTFTFTQHKCQTGREIPRSDLEDVHKHPLFSICQAYQSGKITVWIRSWKPLLVSKGSNTSVEHLPSMSWTPASHTRQAKQLYFPGYLRAYSRSPKGSLRHVLRECLRTRVYRQYQHFKLCTEQVWLW